MAGAEVAPLIGAVDVAAGGVLAIYARWRATKRISIKGA
jgi:hypothetical protein